MIEGEVLVIGLGSIGERHVRNLLRLGQRGITVLRRSHKPPRTLKSDEYRTVTSVESAFERHPLAVIIATPTALHTEYLRRAVEIGAAILVEAPLAHSLTGLGDIGRLLYSRARFGEYLPTCHPWEDYRLRYEARAELGGGAVLTSIHEIDHAFWLLGPIKAVTCIARRCALEVDVEDVAMMVLEHETGVLSEIQLDFVQRTYRRSLEVVGSEGTIEWELLGDRVRIFESTTKEWKNLLVLGGFDINQTYIDELCHFAKVIKREEEPQIDLASGCHVLSVGLAALESSRQGCRVELKSFCAEPKVEVLT